MINLKVLSAAAVMALMLPMTAPTESHAQSALMRGSGGGGGAALGGGGGAAVGGGGGFRGGGGGGMAIGGGGILSGGAAIGGGGYRGGFAGGPGIGTKFGGGPVVGGGPRFSGGGTRHGYPGHRHYPRRGYGYGGFGTGLVIGGALGSSYGYYGAPYGYGYYDDGYYEEPLVAVAPDGDAVEYCKRRFKSYDVRSGTDRGYDGLRHACP